MVQSSAVVAGTNATADQYNKLRNDALLGLKSVSAIATGAVDLSITNDWDITLDDASTTVVFSNATVGQWFQVTAIQDATGGRLITWPAGIKWPGGVAPTLSTAANAIDTFIFKCTATNVYRGYFGGFNMS
ncbi:MAG TPA: hypothetical protein VD999_05825 [Vitreimonas sp.]|nr:hypothetical protein [Vitreimonas sp.]